MYLKVLKKCIHTFKNVSKCISEYVMYMNESVYPNAPQGRYIDKFKVVLKYVSMKTEKYLNVFESIHMYVKSES